MNKSFKCFKEHIFTRYFSNESLNIIDSFKKTTIPANVKVFNKIILI